MIKKERYERTSDEHLILNSCGIQHFFETGGRAHRPKGRVDYHILYVAEGTCYVKTEGGTAAAKAGSLILYRPEQRQEYEYLAGEKSVSYYVHFTGAGCPDILNKLGFSNTMIADMGKCANFERVFERMRREWAMKLTFSEQLCSALLLELLSVAARAVDMRKKGLLDSAEERMTDVCRAIYERIDTVSVSSLAKDCCLSEGRFSHLFKESVGTSPIKYIIELRINKAKELLAETVLSVKEIGCSVGIEDQNYFSRLFRKHAGMSPLEYRKNHG
ncbi:MAG: AraC family transcriptional regulator [Clostridia bacterium]|nr:AraC family transcriptional regulator [Clostridia bacterium]